MKFLADIAVYIIVWTILGWLGLDPFKLYGYTPQGWVGVLLLGLLISLAWGQIRDIFTDD